MPFDIIPSYLCLSSTLNTVLFLHCDLTTSLLAINVNEVLTLLLYRYHRDFIKLFIGILFIFHSGGYEVDCLLCGFFIIQDFDVIGGIMLGNSDVYFGSFFLVSDTLLMLSSNNIVLTF